MRLIREFWNTNACPKGRIGRFALWLMNISHTPMARWYLSLIQFESHWIVLDVGCGGGKNIARLLKRCPQGKVYGVDYSEESVEMSKKTNRKHLGDRCFVEQGNVLDLPYEKEKFHLVTAYETVYFWGDLEKAFAEVSRVLKPGGLFTFSYAEQNAAKVAATVYNTVNPDRILFKFVKDVIVFTNEKEIIGINGYIPGKLAPDIWSLFQALV